MLIEERFCKQCERDFARKTVKIGDKKVPACVPPPCKWSKTIIKVDGWEFTVPCPTGWTEKAVKACLDFAEDKASTKPNTLYSLVRCPSCGCWRHGSNGPNLKCDNCGRAWRKEYSPHRGRPPYSEEERERVGVGTYRRKSGDIRWRR